VKKRILEHLYEVIAFEATFGIVVFHENSDCLFVNRVAQQMLNMDEPALIAMFPGTEKPPFKSFSSELLKHEGLYQDILVRRDGSGTFVANIGIKHVSFDGISAHLLMMQDVTLQKKLQREIIHKQNEINAAYEELLKQNRQLKELDMAKNKFIALTTHELRTPLSAMVASAEILKLGLYDNAEQMKEFIDMIYDQGIHLQTLVNDILDFAKIQAGKMDFFVGRHDLVPLTKAILHGFEGMAETNQVKLIFEEPARPLHCYFDDMRFRQICANMISNAIKYNKADGQVRVHFAANEEFIKLMVQDTGQGIARDQFDRVFNEFETIGQVGEHHKGTGLGMPISRKLCEAMGGKLLFESEVGVGSTFWVELPTKKVLPDSFYGSRPGSSDDLLAS
jgi:signal transduction histidine kinase